jgi:immune inhibitor InhA-like protein
LRPDDVRELRRSKFTLDGKALPDARYDGRPKSRAARPSPSPGVTQPSTTQPSTTLPGSTPSKGTPPVGTVRQWLGLDDTTGKYYRKDYTLRAVGEHIEVWLAEDIAFPKDDCRTNATDVTAAQIAELVTEFDQTIYPTETVAFSLPPDRTGEDAVMDGDFTGDGDKTVTLIDNVRDENYFHFPQAVTYVAGFFSAQLNELFDRNVMTIDGYDWKHRFGSDPADEPTDDLCTSRPARPRMYEGTFAHEWQHLLEYYADPDEETWINEGLSDFAQTLVGYVDGRATVYDRGTDTHLSCFQGFGPVKTPYNANPRDCGGPQNSLNLWDEGAPSEVLADYGNAYQLMLYLRDRFGLGVVTDLHRDRTRRGLAGLQAALPTGVSLYDFLHDFQTMTLLDKVVEGGAVEGAPIDRVTSPSLRSTINLANKSDYDLPGAAPNGADYVPLPTPVTSAVFRGAATLPPLPTGWAVAGGTLFSGNKSELDNAAVRPITVPVDDPTLKLVTSYAVEDSYDFAYVMVSTDGGKTYLPIAGDRTTAGPLGPGLTGASGAVITVTYGLAAYAGKKVLLGLRYLSDKVVNKGGWRIGGITLGGRQLSDGSTLAGWKSPTALVPTPVHAWHVTLAGLAGNRARIVPINKFASLKDYRTVVAIVAYDEPTEQIRQYAPYALTVNGKLQPGGSTP